MKKIGLILGSCLLAITFLIWNFHHKKTAEETHYKRTITSEYTSRSIQEITFVPGSMLIANNQLFVTDAESNTVYLYDLKLKFNKKLIFPVVLRGLVNFSVRGDTAYAVDGSRTLVALNLDNSAFRVRNLREFNFSRIIPLTQDLYLVKGPDRENGDEENDVFKVINSNTGAESMTHNIVKKLNDYGMNSDGFFIRSTNGNIYSVSYLNSSIYAFDRVGRYL